MVRAPFQVLVLPYRRRAAALEVAVFHRSDYDVWQFVSGGGEDRETPVEAARREALEEAGVPTSSTYTQLDSMTMLPACWYSAWPSWPADVLVIPEYAFGVEIEAVRTSDEHRDVAWLSVTAAMRRLAFDSNRHALWELNERLFPGPRVKRFVYDKP